MRFVFLGGTGLGKGTQTLEISKNLGFPRIATGDVLREAIIAENDLGLQAQQYLEKGQLVCDQLMIQFVQKRLLESDVINGWLLEGYPRTAF